MVSPTSTGFESGLQVWGYFGEREFLPLSRSHHPKETLFLLSSQCSETYNWMVPTWCLSWDCWCWCTREAPSLTQISGLLWRVYKILVLFSCRFSILFEEMLGGWRVPFQYYPSSFMLESKTSLSKWLMTRQWPHSVVPEATPKFSLS